MHSRNRLTDGIEIRDGEASRTIRPGEIVDLAEEILPGLPLAAVVRPEWFEPIVDEAPVGFPEDTPEDAADAAKE